MAEFRLRVDGLRYIDRAEVEEQLRALEDIGPGEVAFEESRLPPGSFGEPVTLSIIVGGIALKGLIAWLVLRSRKDRFSERMQIVKADGTRIEYTVEFQIDKDRPVSEQVIERLSDLSGIPVGQLVG